MAELVQEVPPQVRTVGFLQSGLEHQHVAVVDVVGEEGAGDQARVVALAVAQDESGILDFCDLRRTVSEEREREGRFVSKCRWVGLWSISPI